MNETKSLKKNIRAIAWGLIFILWGVTILFDFIPVGVGIAGTGVIFLGVNIFLALKGLPTKSDNTTIGILALVWGSIELANSLLHLPFHIPAFAILLIVIGAMALTRVLLRARKTSFGNLHSSTRS